METCQSLSCICTHTSVQRTALMDFRSNGQFESPAVWIEMWQHRTRPLLTVNWETVSLFTASNATTRVAHCSMVFDLVVLKLS